MAVSIVSSSISKRLVYLSAAFPVVTFLAEWSRGFDYLIFRHLADDAFYYFEVSRHIPEVNVGVPTTGFHPLYAFLASPLHRNLDYTLAVPLSLLILILAYATSTLLVYEVLLFHWNERVSAFTAIAWAVSPQLYAIALDGVETILATCLGLAFLLLFCHLESVGYARARGRLVLAAGLTFALAFLGRMDTPLLIGPLLLSALIQLVRARRTILVAALAFVSGAPPLAWLVMSYLLTGDVMPTSGSAMRTLRGVDNLLFVPSDRMLALTKHLASQLVDFFVYVPPKVEIVLLALMAVTAVIALGKYYSPFAPDVSPSIVRFAILVGCGQVAWISYYILYQGSFRRWYFSQLGVGVFVLVVPAMVTLLSGAVRRVPIWHKMNVSRQQMSKVLLPGACLALSFLSRFLIPPTSPQAYDKYRSALAANVIMAEIDPAATIGAFNSGIYDYFMDRDVINLDGVVNPDSLEAVRHGRLPEYLDRINMKYLIEHDIGEAANLDLLTEDDHIEIVKWVDLSLYYDGYSGAYAKRAYLWQINLTLGE